MVRLFFDRQDDYLTQRGDGYATWPERSTRQTLKVIGLTLKGWAQCPTP